MIKTGKIKWKGVFQSKVAYTNILDEGYEFPGNVEFKKKIKFGKKKEKTKKDVWKQWNKAEAKHRQSKSKQLNVFCEKRVEFLEEGNRSFFYLTANIGS